MYSKNVFYVYEIRSWADLQVSTYEVVNFLEYIMYTLDMLHELTLHAI